MKAAPATFYLIRHGEIDANVERRWHGSTDSELNEKGRHQAELMAEYIAIHHPEISAVYHSPLQRTRHTAIPLAKKLDLEYQVEKNLREYSIGELEDTPYEELHTRHHFFAEIAANPEISQYKLRYVTDSMVILAFKAQSALVYYRTASAMAELVALHRTSIMATVPMAQLGRLMAATDQTSLIVPVVNEMRALALSQMPHWIHRRLVALIFMQAGDALQAGTRQHAFEQLSTLGRASSTSWGVRMEVLTRMNQLAQYTKYADTKASAAKWK